MRTVMVANPNKEELYKKAKKAIGKKNLPRKEFFKALSLFKAQHGYYPTSFGKIGANVPNNVNVVIPAGKAMRLDYKTPAKSKKTKKGTETIYYHKISSGQWVIDISGQVYYVGGKMKLRQADGMFHG